MPTALQCLVHDMLVSVVVAYDWEFFGKISNLSWSMLVLVWADK